MIKDKKQLNWEKEVREKINKCNIDEIHLLYFKYKVSFRNFYKAPILIAMKIFNLFARKKGIDHVAHISRFIKDGDNFDAKIFEATTDRGMVEFDLVSRLSLFSGEVWIEKLGAVDKLRAKAFESQYKGVKYSKIGAINAGVDGFVGKILKKTHPNKKGLFCSQLVGLFLEDQKAEPFCRMNYGQIAELTPDDIYAMNLNLAKKELLIKK